MSDTARPCTLSELKATGWNLDDCPVRQVLDTLSGKWTFLILLALAERTHRFGELRRAISDISQRMLTQTLRELQREGLVERTVHPTVPPSVEYALTGLGRSYVEAMMPLVAWAKDNAVAVAGARATFDAAADRAA